ncbi:hypothetical protein OG762_46350 [Streptomyces sp. NBC_01136]|uniref:hypothetical protein n=1 Tax=unclassified Streptomyces TaxID=2593676 RepID=UPI0032555470|nr:hypothetical protein OG762_00275 [Streptomyces sp. NBC_01136]WST81203.1 hypothetical protein OG762_46350 [Streptomyces sp. NBC_01136]
MSDVEQPSSRHHGYVREIVEKISEHHDRAVRQREEEELAEAAGEAAFDLGADIGLPAVPHRAVGYDVDADLGIDKEPPQLRA